MPISLLPSDRRLFWLKSDAEIELPKRPVFECKSPTRANKVEYLRRWDELTKMKDDEEIHKATVDLIMFGVTGWRNMGRDFSPTALSELLDDDELVEVAVGWPKAFQMTEEERKSFLSPQNSDAENSAAKSVAQDVSTRPRKTRRSSGAKSHSPNAPTSTSPPNSEKSSS